MGEAEIIAWGRCLLLHKKHPVYTGKKIWVESIHEWREEIIWVCDECKKELNIND